MPSVPFLSCVAFACLCLWSGSVVAQDRVIVTLGGDVSERNRDQTGPDDVTFFRVMGVEFESAFAVTDGMLSGLAQESLAAPLPGTEGPEMVFTGPLLDDVAALAGASEKTLAPLALDGYQQDITPDLIDAHSPIFATHMNGVPLAVGDLGPAMIVFPDQNDTTLDEELGVLEVWAVFYIEVK
ncbi:MAG: hypothetical protein AAF965_08140 [Pseudomonadota bacterium]